ncbi:MAG: hypothetical protein EXR60_01905 [Dehalococcoidia bacterium]|nr:hypothetical protein [Dehalococcoidia bacterium]
MLDVTAAFSWWLTTTALGLLAFPVARHLFRALPDQGYSLARPLGLLLLSYLAWLLGLSHIIPNGRGAAVLALAVLAAVAFILVLRRPGELVAWMRRSWRQVAIVEGLYATAFVLFAIFRAYSPEIAGTEKPMDFALLNAILRSQAFPPADPWLSGHSISYYYFGYLQVATVTNLTATAPSLAFNLAQAALFALTATAAFGIGYNLVALWRRPAEGALCRPAIWLGLLGAALVVLMGNLVGVFELLRAHGAGSTGLWDALAVKGLSGDAPSAAWHPTEFWWWWRSTRVIDTVVEGVSRDYTITEFPFFSFLLGDLHPHVMALPSALLALGLGLAVLAGKEALGAASHLARPWFSALAALILGALGFLNSWDLPTYGALFLGAVALRAYRENGGVGRKAGLAAAAFAIPILVAAVLLFLPFYANFSSQASGLAPVGRYTTGYLHFFLVLGPLFLPAATYVVLLAGRVSKGRAWRGASAPGSESATWRLSDACWGVALALGLFLLWVAATVWMADPLGEGLVRIAGRLLRLLPLLALVALAGLSLRTLARPAQGEAEGAGAAVLFALLTVLVASLVLLAPELFYVRDLFNNRMNTIFKLYYQAWLLLAVVAPFCLYYLAHSWRPYLSLARAAKWVWLGVLAVLLAGAFVYSAAAVPSRSDEFKGTPTLDGLAFLRRTNPDLMQALEVLKARAPPEAVVVEAAGGSYTDYGRVSGLTGILAVLGWSGHEHQWRGTTRAFAGREQDIDRIYQAEDAATLRSLLDQYRVTYVFVGDLELRRYGPATASRLAQFLPVEYQNDGVTILKVGD